MIPRIVKMLIVILALSTSATVWANSDSASSQEAPDGKHEQLSSELTQLTAGLPAKKAELAWLHRKWVIAKGRMPTADELKKFAEKQAKGEVKIQDNPYVNKSALSSPGHYRELYYKKLYEIRADEKRIATLRSEINALSQ